MGRARSIFLNFIYIVLLVEVALGTGKIDTDSYYKSNVDIEKSIYRILSRHNNIKQYYSDYLGRLQEKNKDYDVVFKIKTLCEKEEMIINKIKDIKENLIISSGGYNKKQEIKNLADKSAVKKILIGNSFLEKIDMFISQMDNKNINYGDIEKYNNFDDVNNKYNHVSQPDINSQNKKYNSDDIKLENKNSDDIGNNGVVEMTSNVKSDQSEDDESDSDDIEDIDNSNDSSYVENGGNVGPENENNNDNYKAAIIKDTGNANVVDKSFDKKNNIDIISSTLEFKKLTLVEALLKLSQKQLNILIYGDSLLGVLTSNVSGTKNSLDSFDIIVTPKNKTVVPGEDFEADVFFVANNSFVNPKYKINDKYIDIIDGAGKIKIHSPKNISFDNSGISIQSFNVQVEQYDPYTDKNIIVNKEVKYYITKKSNIEGQYATMDSLYRHCGNKYKVRNLAPEINSDISFKFKGGQYKVLNSNKDEYELLLIPKDDMCSLHIYNKSMEIETFEFKVVDVKNPTVSVAFNGRSYGNGDVIQLHKIREANVLVSADSSFKERFSEESEYRIKHFNILFCSGNKIVHQEDVNGDYYAFSNTNKLKNIDKLIIRINDIVRINCNNVEVPVLKNGAYFDRVFSVLKNKDDEEDDD